MRKVVGALCALSVLALADQAGAALVGGSFHGYFDGIDTNGILGPAGTLFSYDNPLATAQYTLSIAFDTSRGTIHTIINSDGSSYQTLDWLNTDVGPSPFTGAHLQIGGFSQQFIPGSQPGVSPYIAPSFTPAIINNVSYTFSTATSFSASRGTANSLYDGFDIAFTSSSGSIDVGATSFASGSFDHRLDQPFDYVGFGGGIFHLPDFPDAGSAPLLQATILGPVAVPEPTTWALLLLGFGAAGAALRRQKQLRAALKYA